MNIVFCAGSLTVAGQAITGGGSSNPADATQRYTFIQGIAKPAASNTNTNHGIMAASAKPALDLTNATTCNPNNFMITSIALRILNTTTGSVTTSYPNAETFYAQALQNTTATDYGTGLTMLGVSLQVKNHTLLPGGDVCHLVVTGAIVA